MERLQPAGTRAWQIWEVEESRDDNQIYNNVIRQEVAIAEVDSEAVAKAHASRLCDEYGYLKRGEYYGDTWAGEEYYKRFYEVRPAAEEATT